jgi:hypothetical protein
MSSLLQKSSRFQQDHERYLAKIEQIPEGEFKQEVKELLNRLISEVRKLDSMHMEMIYTKQMPSMGSDIKQDILTLRKKLDSKLKSLD